MITIESSGYYNFGVGSFGNGSIGAGVGEPFPGFSMLLAGAERYELARSVRCSATGGSKDVTSQSDVVNRWLAAEQVYRRLQEFKSFWDFWGNSNFVDKKGYFWVIYADGYTERWTVVNRGFSMVTPGFPDAGTMEAGSTPAGVVQKDTVCG